jgi:glycolate oxidase
MADIAARLGEIVGTEHVLSGDAVGEDYGHDETLTVDPTRPAHVARPASADEVAAILTLAGETGTPVTARGSGTGLSGAATPRADGILVSFERMNKILEVDT